MQILSIRLKNIKSHAETELNFSPGINVLSGPNGIGKSTIFEAIGYAMFGVDAQSFVGNVERFVSIGAKRGEISVEFQLSEDDCYRVSRTVGSPSKWLLSKKIGGEYEVEEHKDGRETEARLKRLLGLDNGRSLAEQFELVIGPFQHEFLGPFVIKQATKRRDKFDEILGIDSWRKTFKETKQLVSAIQSKVDVLQSAIGPLNEQLAVLPERLKQQQQATDDLAATKTVLEEKRQQYQQLEARLQKVERQEQELKDLTAEIEALKGRVENGRELIASQRQQVVAAEKATQLMVENQPAKLAFEKAEVTLAELSAKLRLQRQLEQEITAVNIQLSKFDGQLAAEEKGIADAAKELQTEQQNVAAARKEFVIDDRLSQQAQDLPQIRSSIDSCRKQLGQLEGRHAALSEGSEKLAEGICPYLQEKCRNIAETPSPDLFADKFADLARQQQRFQAELKSFELQEQQASQASDQLKMLALKSKEVEERAEKLRHRWKAVEACRDGLADLRQRQQQAQQQLAAKQSELAAYGTLQAELDAAEKQKKKYQMGRDLYLANQQQAAGLEKALQDLQKFEDLLKHLLGELELKQQARQRASRNYDAEQHRQLRQQKDALGQQLGALSQRQSGLENELLRLTDEIEKLKQIEEEIKLKRLKIDEYSEKGKLVKFLRNKVFRNVSAHLSERFREEISQRADRIYRTIAEEDEELFWGENYQILLRDMVAGEIRQRTDDQLSGGQLVSAVVALRLALLQTLGARLAFFDEPTSNLDAARRENLAHAFRAIDVGREEVTEHWYDQLFLISHDVAFTEITDQVLSLSVDAVRQRD